MSFGTGPTEAEVGILTKHGNVNEEVYCAVYRKCLSVLNKPEAEVVFSLVFCND